jgi:hypothetical protein|tara:strand:- start:211 stop:366 length:156 start_codon:yes stop_codon:yes gene_type:complete
MEKKYRTKVKPDTKTVGQLAYNKHWSVEGLIASLNIRQEEIDAWLKLNKQS